VKTPHPRNGLGAQDAHGVPYPTPGRIVMVTDAEDVRPALVTFVHLQPDPDGLPDIDCFVFDERVGTAVAKRVRPGLDPAQPYALWWAWPERG